MLPEPDAGSTVTVLSAVLVHERIEQLLGQLAVGAPELSAGDALPRVAVGPRFHRALDQHLAAALCASQLHRAARLDRLEGNDQLIDRQAQVLDLLHVETGARTEGRRRESSEDDEIGTRRERERDHLGPIGARLIVVVIHCVSVASPLVLPGIWLRESWIGNAFASPVIWSTFKMRGSLTIRCNSPPAPRHCSRVVTRTPSAVESRKVAPRRSTYTVEWPAATSAARSSRKDGATARSTSPSTTTMGPFSSDTWLKAQDPPLSRGTITPTWSNGQSIASQPGSLPGRGAGYFSIGLACRASTVSQAVEGRPRWVMSRSHSVSAPNDGMVGHSPREAVGTGRWTSAPGASFCHHGLLYEGENEYLEFALDFLREGVRHGDQVLVLADPLHLPALRDALGPSGSGVRLTDTGPFGRNPARVLPVWQDFVDSLGPEDRARGLAEPVSATGHPSHSAERAIHESLLNLAFADRRPFWLVCPYDTSEL